MIIMLNVSIRNTVASEIILLNFLFLTSAGEWVNVYSGLFDWNFQN